MERGASGWVKETREGETGKLLDFGAIFADNAETNRDLALSMYYFTLLRQALFFFFLVGFSSTSSSLLFFDEEDRGGGISSVSISESVRR